MEIMLCLQDFEALPKPDFKCLLQRIFRDKAMLKVGYGLVMDLCAIAAGLGGEGAGCVSVVTPFIDIGSLHRALYSKGTPGVAKVSRCHPRTCCIGGQFQLEVNIMEHFVLSRDIGAIASLISLLVGTPRYL